MQTKTKKAGNAQGATPATKEKPSAVKTEGSKKAKALANVIDTVVKKEQRFLYRFQLEKDKLNPQKAKQKRQKIRRQLDHFQHAIRMEKKAETKAELIKDFNAFYKENFILNDYTLKSISDSNEQYKVESFTDMLKIVQAHAGKK